MWTLLKTKRKRKKKRKKKKRKKKRKKKKKKKTTERCVNPANNPMSANNPMIKDLALCVNPANNPITCPCSFVPALVTSSCHISFCVARMPVILTDDAQGTDVSEAADTIEAQGPHTDPH